MCYLWLGFKLLNINKLIVTVLLNIICDCVDYFIYVSGVVKFNPLNINCDCVVVS